MAWFKNTAGQKFPFIVLDSNGNRLTGDAANITAQISIDFGVPAATNDANPTELDATDHPGVVYFDATQAETNGDVLVVTPTSSTSGVMFEPATLVISTTPVYNDPSAAAIRSEMDSNSTKLTSIALYADNVYQIVDDIQTRVPYTLVDGRMSSTIDGTGMTSGATQAIRAEIDNSSTKLVSIEADTQDIKTQIGTAGDGLTDLGGMSIEMKTEVSTSVWANDIDGITAEQVQQVLLAVLVGVISTAGEEVEIFKTPDGGNVRVTAAVDADGNRSSVTFSFS